MSSVLRASLAITLALGLTPAAHATDTAVMARTRLVLSRAGAQAALQAAMKEALRLQAPCAVAVVDPSGVLLAFDSFDGVRAGSPDLAIGKARAAALLQRPTSEIEDKTNGGRVAFVTAGYMALRGGMPLKDGAEVVGAIGVAGLNKDNDVAISKVAAAAYAASAARAASR